MLCLLFQERYYQPIKYYQVSWFMMTVKLPKLFSKQTLENISGSDFPAWVYSPQRSFLYTTNMAPQQKPGEMVDIKNEQLALVDTQENKPEIMGFFFFSIRVCVCVSAPCLCACVFFPQNRKANKSRLLLIPFSTHTNF